MTRTSLTYDTLGRLTQRRENQIAGVSSHADPIIRYTYNSAGRLTDLVDPQGGTSSFTYDAFGRLKLRDTPSPENREHPRDLQIRRFGPHRIARKS